MLGGEQYVTLVDSLTRQYLNPTTPTTAAATTFSGGMDSTLSWDVSVMSRENYVRMYPWAPEYVKAKLGLTRIEQEYAEKGCWDHLRNLALERARQNSLCSIERMLLSMFLWDEDAKKSAFFLAHYILTVPEGLATLYHNVRALELVEPVARRHQAATVCDFPEAIW
ncbi:hypothetical protein ABB37_00448 [Leptomonas pyrrhocoris]|uniref:Uncharacterized protein n=1 Tax=Leptomonas pyrrhocoris TaxID=157538 RepID=A0A0M9FQ26_LEPPY|nr:hypothetical protein ABB37_09731 [Leptomonas pyrrhocoris]XP_015664647.1 hypothetical protein ABB37_00448 [Leptomonas pyrrhocoris]KPA73599.1 hypothetical protein ABB37_09731 [Leptomonas pyrrhocoris]KPA86208.1 hypothetical protein ABB37_00448 [Leptomonas pyrrhocoris]|eukprot:XP_015652038.1 hypothetical protein ABB37_09731 [Leptomonas pyrrhocoris]